MRILKIFGVGIAILLVLLVGSLGWFIVQAKRHNSAALASAQELCSRVRTGESLQALRALAEHSGGIYFHNDAGVHTVAFAGYIYDHAECRVTIEGDAVASIEVVMVHE